MKFEVSGFTWYWVSSFQLSTRFRVCQGFYK